jgi:hypothetical protein
MPDPRGARVPHAVIRGGHLPKAGPASAGAGS